MGEFNFNRKQCIRALKRLGFTLSNKRFGKHDKFEPPSTITPRNPEQRYIMVPRHRELRCQPEIVKELRAMGGDELVEQFKELL